MHSDRTPKTSTRTRAQKANTIRSPQGQNPQNSRSEATCQPQTPRSACACPLGAKAQHQHHPQHGLGTKPARFALRAKRASRSRASTDLKASATHCAENATLFLGRRMGKLETSDKQQGRVTVQCPAGKAHSLTVSLFVCRTWGSLLGIWNGFFWGLP